MLKPKDFEELYRDFKSPPTVFDCGKKCAPFNDGEPFCCDTGWVVPIAYLPEWKFLESRTHLWHEFRPRTESEFELMDEIDEDENIFIECRGVAHCERDNRSISCRTFPYEPYYDNDGNFLGLVYNRVLEDKCYLVDRHNIVTKEFIRSFMSFFERLCEKLPSEKELYVGESRLYRQKMSRRKKPVVVITPKGPFEAAHRGGKLIGPWTKPDPPESRYRPKV
ncbi:MAG: hypothetical protein V3V56_00090 [bacterium]